MHLKWVQRRLPRDWASESTTQNLMSSGKPLKSPWHPFEKPTPKEIIAILVSILWSLVWTDSHPRTPQIINWCPLCSISMVSSIYCFKLSTWAKRGITQMQDLMRTHNRFLTCKQFNQRYHFNLTETQYKYFIDAIPMEWINKITQAQLPPGSKFIPIIDQIKSVPLPCCWKALLHCAKKEHILSGAVMKENFMAHPTPSFNCKTFLSSTSIRSWSLAFTQVCPQNMRCFFFYFQHHFSILCIFRCKYSRSNPNATALWHRIKHISLERSIFQRPFESDKFLLNWSNLVQL